MTTSKHPDPDSGATEPFGAVSPVKEYLVLQAAFDHVNRELFDGALPSVLLTFQRGRKYKGESRRGYFAQNRFGARKAEGSIHEIALNPEHFGNRSDEDILSTLVHEMVHLWQMEFGRCGQGGYHNSEWAAKMSAVGLLPTSTGEPGGKQTGNAVTHCIIEAGRFQVSAQGFLKTNHLSWQDMKRIGWPTRKVRYVEKAGSAAGIHECPRCGQAATSNMKAVLVCGLCNLKMLLRQQG